MTYIASIFHRFAALSFDDKITYIGVLVFLFLNILLSRYARFITGAVYGIYFRRTNTLNVAKVVRVLSIVNISLCVFWILYVTIQFLLGA